MPKRPLSEIPTVALVQELSARAGVHMLTCPDPECMYKVVITARDGVFDKCIQDSGPAVILVVID